MLKLNLAVAIVFAMAATAHAQPSLSPGPARLLPAASRRSAYRPDALPSNSLTLADALSVAAGTIRRCAARARRRCVGRALMQAGARPNPEVSFLQEGFRRAERTSTALINQTIELGGKRSARLDVASYGREAAMHRSTSRAPSCAPT